MGSSVSFRQACVAWGTRPGSVTEFFGPRARSSHAWQEATSTGSRFVAGYRAIRAMAAGPHRKVADSRPAVADGRDRGWPIIRMQAQQLEEERARVVKAEAERDAALQLAFRKKIERYLPDPKQFVLDFGDSPEVVDAAEGIADAALETIAGYERRKQATEKARSEQLPAHLPRCEVKLDVPEAQKTCATHGERQMIGYDWQEALEVVPPKLVVRRTGIPKPACPKAPECGVVEAPRPVGLVEGNRYDTSVAAEIMVAKYAYHVPVYRQQDMFASCGWPPSRSTLLNVLEAAVCLIRPLVAHLREVVRTGPIIGTDDTTVTLIVKDTPPPSIQMPRKPLAPAT